MSNIPLSVSLRHDGLAPLEPSLKHSHQSTSSTNISGLASSGSFVRTRSMTRLNFEPHNENEIHRAIKSTTPSSSRLVKSSKLANIDRITGKDRENKDTKDTIPTSRQPLKSKMMDSQSHSALNSLSNKNAKLGGLVRSGDLGKSTGEKQRDGLKRRLEYGEARPRKMLKVHVDTPVLSSSEPFVPTSSTITAPAHSTSSTAAQLAPPHTPRRTVAQSHIPVLQPTPARLLLSSTKLAHQSHGDDSDESFDSDTFVARPPTPPRPHMNSAPEPSVSTTPKSVRRIVARPPTPPRPHIDGSVPESMSTQPADSTIDARLNDGSGTLPASNQSTVLNTVPFSSAQDVEMRDDVPALPPSARISILPQPAASTFRPLSKSTSKRSDLGLGSMPPPSRIPSAVRPPVLTSATPAEGGLVTSRGASQLAKHNSLASLGRGVPTAAEGTPGAGAEPVRRKPSFPSSLSSTTLARPRDRMVSGPVLHRRDLAAMAEDPDNLPPSLSKSRGDLGKSDGFSGRKSPRSVSEPVRRTVPSQPSSSSLTASTSRREGLSLETSKSIAGLSDALNKLKVKRHDTSASSSLGSGSICASGSLPNRPSSGFRDAHTEVPMAKSTSTSGFSRIPVSSSSSRLSSIHQPRQSISRLSTVSADAGGDVSMDGDHIADTSLAALVCSNVGEGCLKGVVAFVDVRTEDGDEANAIFVEMLKGLGARVISRLTENVTHIVYKSGKSTTLSSWRKMDEDERPFIVGIGWITKCKERGERQDEEPYRVAVEEEDVFQKRRKSMEPKALYNALNGPSRPSILLDSSLNIARRKSLLYAPKVSSPLKKAYRRDYSFDEGVEED